MSKDSILAKADFILEMIFNIEIIIKRHNNITSSLNDSVEARPAILMALMQIGETIKKIDDNVLKQVGLLDEKKGAYSVRNFIAHDYEGIDLALIEAILRDKLHILKNKVEQLKIIMRDK